MRVSQTMMAFGGNAQPQLAVTRRLVERGHEVRVLAHRAARANGLRPPEPSSLSSGKACRIWMPSGAAVAAEGAGIPALALVHCPYPLPLDGVPPLYSGMRPSGGRLGALRDQCACWPAACRRSIKRALSSDSRR